MCCECVVCVCVKCECVLSACVYVAGVRVCYMHAYLRVLRGYVYVLGACFVSVCKHTITQCMTLSWT